jgi:hypothetical protein
VYGTVIAQTEIPIPAMPNISRMVRNFAPATPLMARTYRAARRRVNPRKKTAPKRAPSLLQSTSRQTMRRRPNTAW